jgi:hypothetical protein
MKGAVCELCGTGLVTAAKAGGYRYCSCGELRKLVAVEQAVIQHKESGEYVAKVPSLYPLQTTPQLEDTDEQDGACAFTTTEKAGHELSAIEESRRGEFVVLTKEFPNFHNVYKTNGPRVA